MWKPTLILSLLLITSWACSKNTGTNAAAQGQPNSTTQSAQGQSGELKYKVPEGWVVEKPTSSMRAAQYRLPKAGGDLEDATLVLYYFGQGQGGTTEANIDRWINQMQQPDGRSSKEKSKSETLTVNGLKVTTVDVLGTYAAEMTPGQGNISSHANYRLRGAVVETPKGSYFAKLVGPEQTVAHWDEAFNSYVRSFEFK